MRNNVKRSLIEKIKRISFIKTELNRLVANSIFQNKYINNKVCISSILDQNCNKNKSNTISNHRLFCMLNASPKLVNKRFRLSRFKLNYTANLAKITNLMKRG